MTPRSVTIIVVARRRPALVDRCLAALLREAPDLHEVVVVAAEDDAGSIFAAQAWMRREPRVHLALRQPDSESAARGIGAACASGDWCWFVDESWEPSRAAHMALRVGIAQTAARSVLGFPRAPWIQLLATPPCFAAETPLLKERPFPSEPGFERQALLWLNRLRRDGSAPARISGFAPACLPLAGPREILRALRRAGLRAAAALAADRCAGRAALLAAALCAALPSYDWRRALSDWRQREADAWRGRLGRWRRAFDDALRWAASVRDHVRTGVRGTAMLKARLADWAASDPLGGRLSPLFSLYYSCAEKSARAWTLRTRQPIQDFRVHRGYGSGHWNPGVSDIDFAGLWIASPEEEARALSRWSKGYSRLRLLFPMLGEVTMADERSWAVHSALGGFRAGREGPSEEELAAARIEEALLAYTTLTGAFLRPQAGARRSMTMIKGFIDVARLCAAGSARDRAAAAAVLAAGTDAAALRETESGEEGAAAELCARAAAMLETAARETSDHGPERRTENLDGTLSNGRALAHALDAWAGLRSAVGRNVRWAVFDSAAGVRMELAALAEPGGASAWSALRARKSQDPALRGGLVAAGPAVMTLFARSAVCGDPLKSLAWSASSGGAASGSGPLLSTHTMAVCGDASALPSLSGRGRVDVAMGAHAATTLLHWRGMVAGPDGSSPDDRWTRLVGAMLSIRAWAERGELRPGFPLEPLARRHAAAHTEDADWIERRILAAREPRFDAEDIAALSRQARAVCARLDRGGRA